MTTRNRNMTVLSLAAVAMVTLVLTSTAASAATVSSLPYHAYDDAAQGAGTISPFASIFGPISQQDPDGGVGETTSLYDFRGLSAGPVPAGQTYFFLEDMHDGQFDVPGVTLTSDAANNVRARTDDGRNGSESSGANTDNVDEDDGAADGVFGNPRGNVRNNSDTIPVRFTFDVGVLGALPTHVGIVLAERVRGSLTAYDSGGNVLEFVSVNYPGFQAMQFVGVIDESGSGIAYVEMLGDKETDHFQYGRLGQVIPEPSTFALAVLGLLGLMGFRRRRRS